MATSKKFSELPVASSMNNGDLFAVAQEDSQAETGYTSKSATALVVGKKLNGEIEYATDLPSFPPGDQNPLDALEYLNSKINDLYPVNSASGSIVNFSTSLALPLVSLKASIVATESGQGQKSPTNPYTLGGFSNAVIANQSGDNTLASYFRGLYLGTYGFVDLGNLSFTYNSPNRVFVADLTNCPNNTGSGNMPNIACPVYETITARGITNWGLYTGDMVISLGYDTARVFIRNSNYTDATTFANAMSGVYLIYKLATPATPTITPAQFQALCTAFGITATQTTLALGQTVYGGEIVLTKKASGYGVKLIVTYGEYEITGNETFSATGAGQHIIFSPNVSQMGFKTFANEVNANVLFECGESKTYNALNVAGTTDGIGIGNFVIIGSEQYDHWSDFVGRKIYAQLVTPIEIDLTDASDIVALVGVNNVWCDTNGASEVEFKQGVQEYIDSKIAETQALIL